MLETLQQLDQRLLLTLNGLHTPYWDTFMWIVSAKLTWVPLYAALLYLLCRNFKWRPALFTVAAIVLTVAFSDYICASVIRPLVERMRPSNPDNPLSEFVHILHGKRGGRYGFPSCHASNSFALAFFILLLFRQKSITVFLLCWASLHSYSRIYLGVHYPGDLMAGLIVGLCGAVLTYSLYRYLLLQRRCLSFLRTDVHDGEPPVPPLRIKHIPLLIWTGLLTLLTIAVYSAFSLP